MPEYKSPQSEPGAEQRFLLVFVLAAVAIFGSQFLLKKYMPQPPAAAPSSQPASAIPGQPSRTVAPSATASNPSSATAAQPASAKEATTESETVVENDLYRITFTNRGAQAKSWVLKKYFDDDGHPLDLVNAASAKYGYPLSLWTYDEALRNKLTSVLYVASASGTISAPASLLFEYSDSGLVVRKALQFDHSYVVRVETSVFLNGSPLWAFPSWPAGFGDQTNLPAYATGQFEYQLNDNTEHIAAKKIPGGNTLHGNFDWVGTSLSLIHI